MKIKVRLLATLVLGGALVFGMSVERANAVPVAGLSNVTANGDGSFTFIFDSVTGDIDGTGMGLSFNGGGISIIATSAQGNVRQDHPANGGLGVLGGTDNLELGLGETLNLAFNTSVEIVNWTFNGLMNMNGHQDAANGDFTASVDGGSLSSDASNFDGLGGETIPDSSISMCVLNPSFCNTNSISFASNSNSPFEGYLESITIAAVPIPAALPLFAGGLGLLGFMGWRRKRRA